MSLSIPDTAPAAPAANLAPTPAVKSTSDTKFSGPSQKQAPSQAAVAPKAPPDTLQISTAAQTALQESKETQAQTAQEVAHVRPSGSEVAREGDGQQVIQAQGSNNWLSTRHGGIRRME
jgi:hypothetical protein